MIVKAWHETIIIPTYPIGKAEKNPVFIENRVYQGSSGKVYPYPVIESISDEKVDKEWNAVFIENQYLKIMVLPELGGRIQMAFDKIKQRHFIYYNQVIKPALVGLAGPWISGGIEFNWPQHHRPSTFDPVEVDIEENADGSKTIWCNEVELMSRTKGMAGFTLYPEKAYLEVKVKLYNRTPQPQTFLWWANPAVKVNDHYQSVFPPDVHAVFDHGKRDVSAFPIATGTYYKMDYSPATDISKYKNIPVPTSYMAVNSQYDFVGGYENDSKGGVLHVANHHLSPGKKQWTWGHADFGQAWDRNLTDEDGPYIELMCGVYTDNQPDFSWLMPFEERSFEQYFMPYQELGMVKNATKEALVNLDFFENKAIVKLYVTANYEKINIRLAAKNHTFLNETINISPKAIFEKMVDIRTDFPLENYLLTVTDKNDTILVEYRPEKVTEKSIPEPAKPAKLPAEIDTVEHLYLRGLHLEQYRHATYDPRDYYLEALRREPSDVRNNNAMGLWLMRNGQFKKAQPYFEKAIETLTERNPNPYDGEPYFNLGQCLKYQGKLEEAHAAFYKATWNAAWQDSSYFCLAQIACWKKDFEAALKLVEKSLLRNWHHHKARALKATILNYLNRKKAAKSWIKSSLKVDRFNMGVLFEKHLLGSEKALERLNNLMRENIHNYIEYALDYAAAGLFEEAILLLEEGVENCKKYPMAYYFLGWFAMQNGEMDAAFSYFKKGRKRKPDGCFPYRLEAIDALKTAINYNGNDAKAPYYLGNLWYDKKNYEAAIKCWETSLEIDDTFPTIHRNLAIAYYNKKEAIAYKTKAYSHIQKAFELDSTDARILLELTQYLKRTNSIPFQWRCLLEENIETVVTRDDLYLELITAFNLGGIEGNALELHEKALDLLMKRKFHPWEGGEGKVTGQYLLCHIEIAKNAIKNGDFKKALKHLQATENYPHNLGEGKLYGAKENDIFYWKGVVYEGMKKTRLAKKAFQKAAEGKIDLTISRYYNDQQPDQVFYQGLALKKLNKSAEAKTIFEQFIAYGTTHQHDEILLDYFAVSLPDLTIWNDDLDKRNRVHCLYLMGLGYLGLGDFEHGKEALEAVLKLDNNHIGASVAKGFFE